MYDFKTMIDRSNEGSIKWNTRKYEEIPLSVADTDFILAPEIQEGLSDYFKIATFGYTQPEDDYYESIIHWCERCHKVKFKTELIVLECWMLWRKVSIHLQIQVIVY